MRANKVFRMTSSNSDYTGTLECGGDNRDEGELYRDFRREKHRTAYGEKRKERKKAHTQGSSYYIYTFRLNRILYFVDNFEPITSRAANVTILDHDNVLELKKE